MYRYLTLLMLTLFPAIAFAQNDRAEQTIYIQRVDDATTAMKNGNFLVAKNLLTEVLEWQPENQLTPLVMSNLGMCEFYLGEDSLALATLNNAALLAPASVTILLNRAKVKTVSGDVAGGLNDYRRVMELDSLVTTPYFYIGFNELSKGNIEGASENFHILKRLAPDDYETQLAMATLYSSTSREKLAIPYYTRIIEKEKAPEFYVARAYCYLRTGDLFEASEDISNGLELDPSDGDLYLCRALLNKLRYLENDAQDDARMAIELGVPREKVESVTGFKFKK